MLLCLTDSKHLCGIIHGTLSNRRKMCDTVEAALTQNT